MITVIRDPSAYRKSGSMTVVSAHFRVFTVLTLSIAEIVMEGVVPAIGYSSLNIIILNLP